MTNLIGGAINKTVEKMAGTGQFSVLTLLFIGLIIILIKTYLVKVTYNYVVPKVMNKKDTYVLDYKDSFFMVILFHALL